MSEHLLKTPGNLFVVSGPSGCGKSSVCRCAAERDKKVVLSVSATTRRKRAGECDGKDYFFITKDEFQRRIDAGCFYEYACVYDHFYGTLKSFVDEKLSQGFDVILEIDPQGAFQMRQQRPECTLVFIMPPSLEVLHTRLKGRGSETEQQIALRFSKAKEEMALSERYDAVIVNNTLQQAGEDLLDLIRARRR